MTIALTNGGFLARFAAGPKDLDACQALRKACFFGTEGRDADQFDPACQHILIEDQIGLAATCRIMTVNGDGIAGCYAATAYDLDRLAAYPLPMIEVGRLCLRPDVADPAVLRLLWGKVARQVQDSGAGLIFGCASFPGTDPAPYAGSLRKIWTDYPAPKAWAPKRKTSDVVTNQTIAAKTGRAPMPNLLRSYIGMGGWVSDHAVVDPFMQTLHVFVGVEIGNIPKRRVSALMAASA